jgi:hypothetical protein
MWNHATSLVEIVLALAGIAGNFSGEIHSANLNAAMMFLFGRPAPTQSSKSPFQHPAPRHASILLLDLGQSRRETSNEG